MGDLRIKLQAPVLKVASSYHVTSQLIQVLLGGIFNGEQEKKSIFRVRVG